MDLSVPKFSIVVLISGNGSNLQAIIDSEMPIVISAVISSQASAYGLERAHNAGIPTHVVAQQDFPSQQLFDRTLIATIERYQPQLIVLAGYMRRLSPHFVEHYSGKILNIHPSLLPKYPGLHTHRRVLEAGDQQHGVTIHIVNEELDCGPIICQATLPILPEDNEVTLRQRAQQLEHQMYPKVLQWFAEKRLQFIDHQLLWQGQPLSHHDFTILLEKERVTPL
jgi:phosphoribosylglycinamide formyltransferase-1